MQKDLDAVDALHAYVNALFSPRSREESFLIDELTYSNYRHNRTISPDIGPEQWKKHMDSAVVDRMEERFQREAKS